MEDLYQSRRPTSSMLLNKMDERKVSAKCECVNICVSEGDGR